MSGGSNQDGVELAAKEARRQAIQQSPSRGGCFFFNTLVELSGQSERMALRILEGYRAFSNLLASWIEEARQLGILRTDVDAREVADFILTALNGAAALYAASREPAILEETIHQLRLHLDCLKCQEH